MEKKPFLTLEQVQEIVKAYERAAHPAADAENKENNKNFK